MNRALRYLAYGWVTLCGLAGLLLAYGVIFLPRSQAPLGAIATAAGALLSLASPAVYYLRNERQERIDREFFDRVLARDKVDGI
jgi:hypothetical protein